METTVQSTEVAVFQQPTLVAKYEDFKAKARHAWMVANEITEVNEDNKPRVGDVIVEMKQTVKGLDTLRLEANRPLDEQKKAHKEAVDLVCVPLEKMIERLSKAVEAFNEQEREKARLQALKVKLEQDALETERQKKIKEEQEKEQLAKAKGEEYTAKPIPAPVVAPIEAPNLNVRGNNSKQVEVKNRRYEIVDSTLIPREFLMPDEKKIKEAVVSEKFDSIPGVRIWVETTTRYLQ